LSTSEIGSLVAWIKGTVLVSETDVRTQVAVPLLDLLGYPSVNRAEEFPIYGFEGRKPLRAKPADIVLFNSTEHSEHRDRESRGWVADHALVVVELKNPEEPLDNAQGQAQFYAHWAKVPFYVMTNGEEIVVYRMQGFFDDVREMLCAVEELPREWGRISRLLSFEAVKRYSVENEIKTQDLPAAGYADYLRAAYSELSTEVELSMERTVSEEAERGPLAFPIGLSGSVDGQSLSSAPYSRLLHLDSSVVVTAELGGGKTHLIKMLARDLIRATEEDPEAPVPVVLRARMWGRVFGSIAEGIKKEIDDFVPGPAEGAIQEDIEAGHFILLVDGLDEAPREGLDLLYAELLRVARRMPTRVIATCRKQDYKQELRERFDECSIDPLTRDQVIEYASREFEDVPGAPTGVQFLYGIGEDLAQMVLNPLFLVMTVAVMKTKTGGRIPKNRAELYSDYANALLEGWERRRGPGGAFEVDPETKATVLAEYARAIWRRPPDDAVFNSAVAEKKGFWDGAKVREELFRSGLLRAERGGPEFFHPSFKEYFYALDVSRRRDEELARFVEENHSDDTYIEVFAFLVGMLDDENRQALVLDRLEINNLYLFRRCLNTRSSFGTIIEQSWPEGYAKRYLGQLRNTYARLAGSHFRKIRYLLRPWYPWLSNEAASRYEIRVTGNLDPARMALDYNLNFVERTIYLPKPVVIGYPSTDNPFGFSYRNLAYSGRGLDSAREVALDDLKSSLKKALEKKRLPLGNNHALGVQYVEEELRKLRNAARCCWGVPEEFKELSLRRSVEEVMTVVEKHPHRVTFAKQRESPATGFIETHADFPRMRAYLEHLAQDGLDPQRFLLPPIDVPDEEIARRSSGGSVLVDKIYSDEAVVVAVCRFYDHYQAAYRWIAENLFPTLKDQLFLYRVGPVRHRALIFRNLYDEPDFGEGGNPSWVFLEWEPVANTADSATICEVTYDWPYDQGYDVLTGAPRVRRALQELGRMNRLVHHQMRFGGGYRLSHYFTNMAVHEEVYKQLEQDIVRDLLGDTMSRLP
jgi:Type I restriction enzyme R protein N terminus (HSDR_N)